MSPAALHKARENPKRGHLQKHFDGELHQLTVQTRAFLARAKVFYQAISLNF
jgi:hypothetical protein